MESTTDPQAQQTNPPATPPAPEKKRKGQHPADCKCGWCATRAKNLAKKKSGQPSGEPKASGEGSSKSSPPKSSPASPPSGPSTMAHKIAEMKNEIAPVIAAPPAQPAKKAGWFEELISGPSTFFEA